MRSLVSSASDDGIIALPATRRDPIGRDPLVISGGIVVVVSSSSSSDNNNNNNNSNSYGMRLNLHYALDSGLLKPGMLFLQMMDSEDQSSGRIAVHHSSEAITITTSPDAVEAGTPVPMDVDASTQPATAAAAAAAVSSVLPAPSPDIAAAAVADSDPSAAVSAFASATASGSVMSLAPHSASPVMVFFHQLLLSLTQQSAPFEVLPWSVFFYSFMVSNRSRLYVYGDHLRPLPTR